MRHRLKRGVFVGLGVVAGVSLCVMISFRRSSSDLEAWKKRMSARGEKLIFVQVSKPFSQAAVDWELSLSNLASRLAKGPRSVSDLSLMATNKTGHAWPAWRREHSLQKQSTNFRSEYISQMGSNEAVFAEVRNLIASKPNGSAYDPARLFSSSPRHNFVAWRTWRQESLRRVTLTAIALKRYQLRHGRLPDNLAKLVHEFMPNELLDPMSGKGLRFQPAASGTPLLYSVGENGVDDGGLGDDVYWPRLSAGESDTDNTP